MEKNKVHVHAVTVNFYLLLIVLLVIIVAILGLKYIHLRWSLNGYTYQTMQHMMQPAGTVNDYAAILATTVAQYPQPTPMYLQSSELQNYVTSMSQNLGRDVVVLDTNKKILADTVSANKGSMYTYDTGNEIMMTLKDGSIRSFLEMSTDYPRGVREVVYPMKSASGQIVGAVLVSTSTVK